MSREQERVTGELCDEHEGDCEKSLSDRAREACVTWQCSGGSPCLFTWSNSCGGYTFEHLIGVDARSDKVHYDADGKAIGFAAHVSPPCSYTEIYGMKCEITNRKTIECDEADAGPASDWPRR